jgi:GT2 family glycosyltransferase
MPKISVIIVNYNDKDNLETSVEALKEDPKFDSFETIVIDNGSSDGSQVMLKEKFPDVQSIENDKNVGFSAACNQGFKKSKGSFILFINPDTRLEPETMGKLLDDMEDNPSTGASGPVLLRDQNAYQVSFGGKRTFLTEILPKFLFNPYHKATLRYLNRRKNVTWLSGACLFLRREVFEETEGFDENFFLYFEDIDLCYRIRQKGWDLVLLPEAKAFHKGGTATQKDRLFSQYHYRRSQVQFYSKHNTWLSNFSLRVYLRILFFFLPFSKNLRSKSSSFGTKDFYRLLEK